MQAPVSVHVNADGTVHLPYAGTLKAQGLTPDQLQGAISDALRNRGIVKDPNVTVDVLLAVNMSVAVIGEVLKPTSIPLYAPAPVSYILTQAGGITSMASPHVTILHPGGVEPTSIDYERNSPSSDALRTLVRPGRYRACDEQRRLLHWWRGQSSGDLSGDWCYQYGRGQSEFWHWVDEQADVVGSDSAGGWYYIDRFTVADAAFAHGGREARGGQDRPGKAVQGRDCRSTDSAGGHYLYSLQLYPLADE